jgi:hypothetical protein
MQSLNNNVRADGTLRRSRRRLFSALALWFALTSAGGAAADTFKSEAELRPFGDRVMATVVKSGMPAAYDLLKPYLLIPESEFQSVLRSSKSQRDQFAVRYGKTLGYDFVGSRKAGESLVRIVYIEKTEKHALPWTFYFYKTPAGWVLNAFHWNDQVPALFFP